MSVFHQMGHDSQNLIGDVPGFAGAILSPVNYEEATVQSIVATHRREGFEFVFDGQLYVPGSERGELRTWDYFPSDFDTADLSSGQWWDDLNQRLYAAASRIGVATLCSGAALPNDYSDDYYEHLTSTASTLAALVGSETRVLQTVPVRLADMGTNARVMRVSSIVSRTKASGVYLVLVADQTPRIELGNPEELKGTMKLIRLLEQGGVPVLVAFCGSEMLLWKAAGATACATGKFFNLRRFTRGRFEEPQDGGGQVAYWFEEALAACLRDSDLTRVETLGLLSDSSQRNPYSVRILEQRLADPARAWVGLGWRQYMWWFADAEARIATGGARVADMLRTADTNWERLDEESVLMEERRNDGRWVRSWRRALGEYLK